MKIIIACSGVAILTFLLGYALGSDTILTAWIDENWEDFFPALGTIFAGIALIIAIHSHSKTMKDSRDNKRHLIKMDIMEQVRYFKLELEEETKLNEVSSLIEQEAEEIIKKFQEADNSNIESRDVTPNIKRIIEYEKGLSSIHKTRLGLSRLSENEIILFSRSDGKLDWAKRCKKLSQKLASESRENAIEYAKEYQVVWELYQNINLQDRKHLVEPKDLKEAIENKVKDIRD